MKNTKVLHLNYGRPTPTAEPDGDSVKYFEIETFRLVHGHLYITPKGGEIHKDEIGLTMISGHCYYDGVYYSDVWVEDLSEMHDSCKTEVYDIEKSKAPQKENREYTLSSLIYRLKTIDSWDDDDSIDGETTQYVIEQLGMDEQMLRQLVLTADADRTELLLEEKAQLAGSKRLSRQQLVNRLAFITDDVRELKQMMIKAGVDFEFIDGNAPLGTILANIEIASNPNDSEPEAVGWIAKKYYELGIDEGDDVGTRTLKNCDTKEEAEALKEELEGMFPDMKLFVDSCTYDYMKRG